MIMGSDPIIYQFQFHKKATKEYSQEYFKRAEEIYLWLKKQL